MEFPPLSEVVKLRPNIYDLAAELRDAKHDGWYDVEYDMSSLSLPVVKEDPTPTCTMFLKADFWGCQIPQSGFTIKPINSWLLVHVDVAEDSSPTALLEEAYCTALEAVFWYIGKNGSAKAAQDKRPVVLVAPDLETSTGLEGATTSEKVMDSLIHNLSLAWGLQLDGQTLRQKLTAIRNLALSHERTSAYSPLLIITDLDLAREDFRMTFFLEAIRHQIVHKEGGSLIFFASTDWTMADAWAEINNFGIICDKCPIT